MQHRTPTERRHIGLLLFDGVEELDAVGPWEVLAFWTQQHPEDGWDIATLSIDGKPACRRQGPHPRRAPLAPGRTRLDVLIHPGGPGTRPTAPRRRPPGLGATPRATPCL